MTDSVELRRGASVVSSLAGAFGGTLRETRLTALLGYLIALEPRPFLEKFGITCKATNVRIEHNHGKDRSDILIETDQGRVVIEAKVDVSDPWEQSKKYRAHWTVLLSQYRPSSRQRRLRPAEYLRWQELKDVLCRWSCSRNTEVRFVSRDLLRYLEAHRMIRQRQSVEVYAREINEPITLALFLKAQIYGCRYEADSQLPEALYFAPYFGQAIAQTHPGVRVGISYVAQIEQVEVVETWQDFSATVKSVRKKTWWNSHLSELKSLETEWNWDEGQKYSFLFLAKPRLVFNPPVHKEKLQTSKGFLGKRVFSYDELFQAWGC